MIIVQIILRFLIRSRIDFILGTRAIAANVIMKIGVVINLLLRVVVGDMYGIFVGFCAHRVYLAAAGIPVVRSSVNRRFLGLPGVLLLVVILDSIKLLKYLIVTQRRGRLIFLVRVVSCWAVNLVLFDFTRLGVLCKVLLDW